MDKNSLLDFCKNILEERIGIARDAMNEAQNSANSEEKSSAGDKYETSRAMGQINRDMNARQLVQAKQDLDILLKINPENIPVQVTLGAFVQTNKRLCFIATGLGSIEFEGKKIVVISPSSPLATAMSGKKKGEKFQFNGVSEEIKDIC